MTQHIRALRAGERIDERWLSALVEAVNRAATITAAPPLQISTDAAGTRISLARQVMLEIFELTDDLAVGGSAPATLKMYDGTMWVDMPLGDIEVFDPLGTFEGAPGTWGWAKFHEGSGRWEIVQLSCGVKEV